jgi:YcxB-like protein
MLTICTAKYRWTREELVKAMQHHQRLKIRRGVLLTMKIFSAVLLIFVGLVTAAWFLLPSTSSPPFWALLVLALFSLYWLTFDKLNRWYWSRGFSKRPDANVEIEWQFFSDQITMRTDLGTATVTWQGFFKVVETTEGFLFYPLKKLFHWLPFTAFESPECIAKVRQLIGDNGY